MKKFSLALEVVLMTLFFAAKAQDIESGTLQGRIFDEQTQNEIANVPVILQQNGVQKATVLSNDSGLYVISEILPGTYDMKIVFGKYHPMIIKNVLIDSSDITLQDVPLKPSTDKLEEIVVMADKVIRLVELAKEILELGKNAK